MPTGYRLKAGFESFDITDGPDAGRRFVRGLTYADLPAGFEARFEPEPSESTIEEKKPVRSKKPSAEVNDAKL